MKYLSDHARIVILEKKLERLKALVTSHIAVSDSPLIVTGEPIENTPVAIPKKVIGLITPYSEQIRENQENQEILQPFDSTGTTCPIHNSLRNPNELS